MKRQLPGILCIFIFFGNLSSLAQIDFSRYVDENALPLLNLNDHLAVNFKWNMKGTIQAELNEGLNNLNNPRLAIANFDEVIKLDSASWVGYYYRGVCYKNLYQFKDAERDFLTAQKLNATQATKFILLIVEGVSLH